MMMMLMMVMGGGGGGVCDDDCDADGDDCDADDDDAQAQPRFPGCVVAVAALLPAFVLFVEIYDQRFQKIHVHFFELRAFHRQPDLKAVITSSHHRGIVNLSFWVGNAFDSR